jgi:hypothetical protein
VGIKRDIMGLSGNAIIKGPRNRNTGFASTRERGAFVISDEKYSHKGR